MSGRLFASLALLVTLPSACAEPEPLPLVGDWRAVSVTEQGDSLRLDPAEVSFTFGADNRYAFASTLRHREAGTWRYDRGFLIARDTTRADSPERVVAVEKMTADSLELRMMNEGRERLVTLLRE